MVKATASAAGLEASKALKDAQNKAQAQADENNKLHRQESAKAAALAKELSMTQDQARAAEQRQQEMRQQIELLEKERREREAIDAQLAALKAKLVGGAAPGCARTHSPVLC